MPNWTIVLPVMLTEPGLTAPSPTSLIQDWALDTGNRGEALAWRHHLISAGLNPLRRRFVHPVRLRTAAGIVVAPVRDADLWLVSNLPDPPDPLRLLLERGLPFIDSSAIPDPHFQRPLIGIRALLTAGLRVELDFAVQTVSVWTPDP